MKPASFRRARALVVDDDSFSLKLFAGAAAILELRDLVACTSAREALQLLEEEEQGFDIIFFDLNMPGMDGLLFLRALLKRGVDSVLVPVSGEAPAIVSSTLRLLELSGRPVLGHIRKPVGIHALRELLGRWLTQPPRGIESGQRLFRADELGEALDQGQLVPWFQPKVCLHTSRVLGVEALARWQHPTFGLVGPGHFVTLAEENGLIDRLTAAVIGQSLDTAREWRYQGLRIKMSVNLSMASLSQPDCASSLLAWAEEADVSPSQLVVEVTESRQTSDPVAVIETLTRLRLHRVGISLDDFGTGYSFLTQLRDIPFVELKVDRGFVHGAAGDEKRRAILAGSVAVAKELGIEVVAEGAEDDTDLAVLRTLGFDQVQGYVVARPMPGAELVAWAQQWDSLPWHGHAGGEEA